MCVGKGPVAYLLDPVSLVTLSKLVLPTGGNSGSFGSGGYFFLDNEDRAIIPTQGRGIWRIKEIETTSGPQLVKDHTCANDLPAMIPMDQAIQSTLSDAHGLLWFTWHHAHRSR